MALRWSFNIFDYKNIKRDCKKSILECRQAPFPTICWYNLFWQIPFVGFGGFRRTLIFYSPFMYRLATNRTVCINQKKCINRSQCTEKCTLLFVVTQILYTETSMQKESMHFYQSKNILFSVFNIKN